MRGPSHTEPLAITPCAFTSADTSGPIRVALSVNISSKPGGIVRST